jgi:hypothetical protein
MRMKMHERGVMTSRGDERKMRVLGFWGSALIGVFLGAHSIDIPFCL